MGLGAQDKAQEIANLQLIGVAQEKLLPVGLVRPENLHYTAERLVHAMGYKEPDKFFSPPNPNPQPEQPPLEIQVEQLRQQGAKELAVVNAQASIQVEQMKQQAQAAQSSRELELQAERDRMEMENQMELEVFKVEQQKDLEITKAQIAQATELEKARIGAQSAAFAAVNEPVDNDRQD